VTDQSLLRVAETVGGTIATHCKLTLLVGPAGSGKTIVLGRIAAHFNYPLINLSLLLSRRLLSLNTRQRSLQVREIAAELTEFERSAGVCIDNTELLFDKTLHIDPLRFFQELARNRAIIATWNGTLRNGQLTYAWPGHPDEFDRPAAGFPVVALTSVEPEIHLTA